MLGGRDDVAVLWGISGCRRGNGVAAGTGEGIGLALFRAAGDWAGARGVRWLKIETQNVNVPACRFYQKMGCTLGAIDRFAYPSQPAEARLLWWKALAPPDTNSS
jgi:ribosomal protein S18 acetylase RimI-like enzyme